MRPFFSFYGSKWRVALRYPRPTHRTLIEPFAGSAGYSTRYADRDVVLIEKDPVIAALWRYLISTPAADVRAIPLLEYGQTLDEIEAPEEAKPLIGFWLNKGGASVCKTPSAWMRDRRYAGQFWGAKIRERVASQVDHIRHWTVIEGDYSEAPDVMATYFVDAPYEGAGKYYRHSASALNFEALGTWCASRNGQVMVCENEGATWLPFVPFAEIKANESAHGGKTSREVLWRNDLV